MPAYVALIRAIGPVTHVVMKMAALRAACEDAGLADVATVGNTGNLVFRSNKGVDAARRLVQGVVTGFGLGPAQEVFVRTPDDMSSVVATNPFPDVALGRPADIGVCSFHMVPDWTPILDWPGPERLAMVGAHLVVDYPSATASSRLNIEKLLGARMTQRNWRVFARLSEKVALLAG